MALFRKADPVSTFVGIDIGGTYVRLGIVDAWGRVQADRITETPRGNDGDDLVRWLEEAYLTCRGEVDSQFPPEAIGVAVPGILEPGRSAVIRSINCPFLEGLTLRDQLVERTGLVTMMDGDTVCGAWGEFCAAEKNAQRFAYLSIGTGIGGAVILGGQVLRHSGHSVGHVGHLICDTGPDAALCGCGATGCLEAHVAGPALDADARESGMEGGVSGVERAFQDGDPSALAFVDRHARQLAIGLINLVHVYPVDVLVVGGGVAIGLPSLIRQAANIASRSASILIPEKMRVELTALREYAGVVGAALLVKEYLRERLAKE